MAARAVSSAVSRSAGAGPPSGTAGGAALPEVSEAVEAAGLLTMALASTLGLGWFPLLNDWNCRYGRCEHLFYSAAAVLTGLRLENIALIEQLELDFQAGFTVLTGETGAGKSILLDALDVLLGGGPPGGGSRLLRQGCRRARIEASFALTPPLLAWLEQQQLTGDEDELLLSREWRLGDGRLSSRHRLNGVAVNRVQVQELRPLLMDLTVQGQTQQLARPGQQRRWLDRFGGEPVQCALEPAAAAWRAWRAAARALEQARSHSQELERQRAQQQELLAALEAAGLEDPQERLRLQQEQDRLAHGVRLQEGVMTLLGRLQEGAEAAPAVIEHLAACDQELQLMAALDGSLQPLRERLGGALAELQELARELDRYGGCLESDAESLEQLQQRIADLRALERRHGLELAELIDLRDRLRTQLAPGGPAAAIGEDPAVSRLGALSDLESIR